MEKEQLILSEYSEICISCGQAYLNNVLNTIDMNHWEFINIFIQNSDDVFTSTLKICMLCCEKLGQFKVFLEKFKNNLKNTTLINERMEEKRRMLNLEQSLHYDMFKEPDINEKNTIEIVLHNSKVQEVNTVNNVENSITITRINIEDIKNEKENVAKYSYQSRKKLCTYYDCFDKNDNQMKPLDLKIKTVDSNQMSEEMCVTPDIVINNNSNVELSDDNSYLIIDDQDPQFIVPKPNPIPVCQTQAHGNTFQPRHHIYPQEKRRLRNREASRRYRERARQDPELLKKMREQQKKRQKKYYAKVRKESVICNEI